MTNLNDYLNQQLALTAQKQQQRHLPEVMAAASETLPYVVAADGQKLMNFSSNDYLGLARHPKLIAAAVEATQTYGAGSCASRLIGGHVEHVGALEQAIASYRGSEAALVFSSGYAANTGTISALMNQGDLVLADKLAHACLLDGAKLSSADLHRFRHNDVAHLAKLLELKRSEYANCLIVTESIFSMDGDLAPIDELVALAKQYDCWVMVDDAHGAGFSSALLAPVIAYENGLVSGTLSKAIGALGGYVAGSEALKSFLVGHARSFMFSTALPPGVIAAALAGFEVIGQEPQRASLALEHAQHFTKTMGLPAAQSPIVPYIIGDNEATMHATQHLAKHGIYTHAIRPPTVPPGTARLRLTFTAGHTQEYVDHLLAALRRIQ